MFNVAPAIAMMASRHKPASGPFDPLSLNPDWWSVHRPPNLFTDAAHTTPVALDRDRAGALHNLGSQGGYVTQDNNSQRPLYREAGGTGWLRGDAANGYRLFGSFSVAGKKLYAAAVFRPRTANNFDRLVSIADSSINDFDSPARACVVLRLAVDEIWGGYCDGGARSSANVLNNTIYFVESIWENDVHTFSVNGVDSAPASHSFDFSTSALGIFGQAGVDADFANADFWALFMRQGTIPTIGERTALRNYMTALIGPVYSLDPTLWLQLNDNSGTTPVDDSGHGNNATFTNTPTWDAGPPVSLAFQAADSDGLLISGLLGSPAAVTLCAWVNVNTVPAVPRVISVGNAAELVLVSSGFGEAHFDGGFRALNYTGGSLAGSGWRHIAAVIDPVGSRQEIYLDGVSVGTASLNQAINYGGTGVPDSYVGNLAGVLPFDGRIRQAIVAPVAATTDQIVAVMAATS